MNSLLFCHSQGCGSVFLSTRKCPNFGLHFCRVKLSSQILKFILACSAKSAISSLPGCHFRAVLSVRTSIFRFGRLLTGISLGFYPKLYLGAVLRLYNSQWSGTNTASMFQWILGTQMLKSTPNILLLYMYISHHISQRNCIIHPFSSCFFVFFYLMSCFFHFRKAIAQNH